MPIGNNTPTTNRFMGSFNGNGYNITDLYINRSGNTYVGLFGFTNGANKNFVNVGLVDVNVIQINFDDVYIIQELITLLQQHGLL